MAQLKDATITESQAQRCRFHYTDFSNGFFYRVDFTDSRFDMALLHNIVEESCNWSGANRGAAQGTNEQLKKAETWGK